jgi:enoyl-CoA hydratase
MASQSEGKYCTYTVDGSGVALMTINNPPMNALSRPVLADMKDTITRANGDPAVRAVVFTGAGKAFIAGADIREFGEIKTAKDGSDFLIPGQSILNLIEGADKPYIAAINGFCLGGGLETALACHMRYADESAQIGLPEIKLGIMPGYGGTQRSTRLIGTGRAYELILSGNFLSGRQAELYGVVNRAFAAGTVVDEAKRLAAAIASRSRLAVRNAMRAIRDGLPMEMTASLEFERELFGELSVSEDKKEGTAAFLEKREPKFKDR